MLSDKLFGINRLRGNFRLGLFYLTSLVRNPKIQSHTGFGGCEAVGSDSPMYIPL
jgi:hypothetical protein